MLQPTPIQPAPPAPEPAPPAPTFPNPDPYRVGSLLVDVTYTGFEPELTQEIDLGEEMQLLRALHLSNIEY